MLILADCRYICLETEKWRTMQTRERRAVELRYAKYLEPLAAAVILSCSRDCIQRFRAAKHWGELDAKSLAASLFCHVRTILAEFCQFTFCVAIVPLRPQGMRASVFDV